MKVAISVPNPLFDAADVLARQLKKSRSELYAEAVAAYVGAHASDAVRRQLDAVLASLDSSPDAVMTQLQLRTPDPDDTW